MRVDYETGMSGVRRTVEFEAFGFDPTRAEKVVDGALKFALNHKAFSNDALSHDKELAMHQDFSRLVMSCGTCLERFIDLLLNEFPYEEVHLEREQRDEWFELAFDEQTVSMHRLLMRRAIEGKSVSLGELTEIVYPQSRTSDFNKKRRDVRDKYLCAMEEMWLWNVTPIERTNRHGKREIARYEISAGPGLRLFSRSVFSPLRQRILTQLLNRLEGE